MITITPLCPVCLNSQTPCERKIWTVRGTVGPIEEFNDIYLIGTIIGLTKDSCLGSSFIGKFPRRDFYSMTIKLYEDLNFKYFFAYRQPGKIMPMSVYITSGYYKGTWKLDLKKFIDRIRS